MDDSLAGDWQQLTNIVRDVYSFADRVYQQRVWIDGTGPGPDCYIEALCRLFDDANVELYMQGYALEFGFTNDMLQRLRLFVSTLKEFDDLLRGGKGPRRPPEQLDSEIVAMPGWETVTQRAAEFLDSAIEWFEVHGNEALMFEWSWGGKTFGDTASDPR